MSRGVQSTSASGVHEHILLVGHVGSRLPSPHGGSNVGFVSGVVFFFSQGCPVRHRRYKAATVWDPNEEQQNMFCNTTLTYSHAGRLRAICISHRAPPCKTPIYENISSKPQKGFRSFQNPKCQSDPFKLPQARALHSRNSSFL